jgi:hypothetical protein
MYTVTWRHRRLASENFNHAMDIFAAADAVIPHCSKK